MVREYWYVPNEHGPVGPVTVELLRTFLSERNDWREVPVWKDGFDGWKKADEVEELRQAPRPPPFVLAAYKRPPPYEPEKAQAHDDQLVDIGVALKLPTTNPPDYQSKFGEDQSRLPDWLVVGGLGLTVILMLAGVTLGIGALSIWHWIFLAIWLALVVIPIALADPKKSLTRKYYVLRSLICFGGLVLAAGTAGLGALAVAVTFALALIVDVLLITWSVHRTQDVGWSRWWNLLFLIPIAWPVWWLILMAIPPNRSGQTAA